MFWHCVNNSDSRCDTASLVRPICDSSILWELAESFPHHCCPASQLSYPVMPNCGILSLSLSLSLFFSFYLSALLCLGSAQQLSSICMVLRLCSQYLISVNFPLIDSIKPFGLEVENITDPMLQNSVILKPNNWPFSQSLFPLFFSGFPPLVFKAAEHVHEWLTLKLL